MKTDFLKSSNFWTAVMLAIGGIFVGFPQDAGAVVAEQFFALLGTGKLLHEYFKTKPGTDVNGAVNRSNWWNYIAVILTSAIPAIPGSLINDLQTFLSSLLSSNWQGVLVALFSIATILFNLFKSKEKLPSALSEK